MKRILLAAILCAPFAAFAADAPSQGNAEAGAAKAAGCVACHGPAGNSANPEWPNLAGQNARYVHDQLARFKSGARQNALMAPMAAPLSDADMRDLGAYFAAQPASAGVASEAAVAIAQPLYRGGDAARGIPACAACHLPDGAGVASAGYPHLGGQHATYAASRLKAYRSAGQQKDVEGGNFGVMAAVAARLSDEEITALASYINGLQ